MEGNSLNTMIKHILTAIVFLAISCQGRTRENNQPEETQDKTSEVLYYRVVSDSYVSNTLGGVKRSLKICLPSDYDTISHKLPALYLFHGSGGNELSWIEHGNLLTILNQAYRSGQMVPMVVVLPFCVPEGSNYLGVGPEGDPFVKEVIKEIIPFIESNYNVSSLRENRAVGGYSAGGMQTLNLALFFPEMFGYVYPISTCFHDYALNIISSGEYNNIMKNPEINNIKEFFISIGLQDRFYEQCQKTLQFLDAHNILYHYWESEGGHEWAFYSLNFEHMLVELFRM